MASDEVVYGLVVPLVGTILGWILSVAPIPHLIKAEPTGELGDFSPYPSIVFLASSCTWFMYGCQRGLTFVILSNGVAILILLYVILRCHRLADNALRLRMEGLAFALLTVDLGYLLALTGVKGAAAKATMEEVIGSTAVALNTIMFVVPLSSMASILKHRDSSSVFLPWAAASTVCSLCWTLYGLIGVKDILVAFPNVVGLVLGGLQLTLRAIFPAKAAIAAAAEDAANAATLAEGVTAAGAASAADGSSAATANPIAAARKLSSSKHLLVRNDSFTEMRRQQQAEMVRDLAAPSSAPTLPASSSSLAPDEGATAAAAPVPAPPAVAPNAKAEEEADAMLLMAAAS